MANRQLSLCSGSNTYNIFEFSLSETYAPKQIRDEFTAVRPLCVGANEAPTERKRVKKKKRKIALGEQRNFIGCYFTIRYSSFICSL